MSIGRNDPCPCGSGRKYKKCCLSRDERRSRGAPSSARASSTASSAFPGSKAAYSICTINPSCAASSRLATISTRPKTKHSSGSMLKTRRDRRARGGSTAIASFWRRSHWSAMRADANGDVPDTPTGAGGSPTGTRQPRRTRQSDPDAYDAGWLWAELGLVAEWPA